MNIFLFILKKENRCSFLTYIVVLIFMLGVVIVASDTFDAFDSINAYIEKHPQCNNRASKYYDHEMKSFKYYDCHNTTCNMIYEYTLTSLDGSGCNSNPSEYFIRDKEKLSNVFLSCIYIEDASKSSIKFTDCYNNVSKKELMNMTSATRVFSIVVVILLTLICVLYYMMLYRKIYYTNITPTIQTKLLGDNTGDD